MECVCVRIHARTRVKKANTGPDTPSKAVCHIAKQKNPSMTEERPPGEATYPGDGGAGLWLGAEEENGSRASIQ